MKTKYLPVLLLAAVLAGCASGPPKPVLPDGAHRQQINDPASIRKFMQSRQAYLNRQQQLEERRLARRNKLRHPQQQVRQGNHPLT